MSWKTHLECMHARAESLGKEKDTTKNELKNWKNITFLTSQL